MAYPRLRSMGGDLLEGATDGTFKKANANWENQSFETYDSRRDLDDVYYGIHEASLKYVPGRGTVSTPNYVPTKAPNMLDW